MRVGWEMKEKIRMGWEWQEGQERQEGKSRWEEMNCGNGKQIKMRDGKGVGRVREETDGKEKKWEGMTV